MTILPLFPMAAAREASKEREKKKNNIFTASLRIRKVSLFLWVLGFPPAGHRPEEKEIENEGEKQ